MKKRNVKVGIGRLCILFGKTRHAFYDMSWHKDRQKEDAFFVLEMVTLVRREMPNIGTIKLYRMLYKSMKTQGVSMGRDNLHKLLQENNLTVKPKKRYIKTTDSNHWMKKYPNLIKELVIIESEHVWVSDITYIIVSGSFNFLSLITDAYSKQIMGYCLYPTLEGEGCINALKMALSKRTKTCRLIHHSDRGAQYCSFNYVDLLQKNNIEISMAEKGNPYENAIAERVNGILKKEFFLNQVFPSREEAINAVVRSIETYNHLRPHLSCDFLTPVEAHKMNGELKKHWKKRKFQVITKDDNIGFNKDTPDNIFAKKAKLSLQENIPAFQDVSSGNIPLQKLCLPILLKKNK